VDQAEFLREQSAAAKNAMGATLRDARQDAAKLLDPRIWVKSHPWKTLTVAAAVGFAVGDAVRKPRKTPEPQTPQPETKHPAPAPAAAQVHEESKIRGLLLTLLKRGGTILLAAVQPIIREMISTYTASHNGSPHPESTDAHAGYAPSSPPPSSPFHEPGRP
jgi:hypothetical protein